MTIADIDEHEAELNNEPLDGMTWVDGEYVDCLPLSMITPWSGNPRKSFDQEKLAELAASIAEHGVQQPILVRYVPDQSKLSIVMGESRWRASRVAGRETIPAKIRVGMSDRTALELALIENVQRKDLTPLESAEAMRRLVDMGAQQKDLARRLGIAESTISNALRTLSLPEAVIDMVRDGKIEMGVAKALVRFAKWPVAVTRMAELLATDLRTWSVREVERSFPGGYNLQKEGLVQQIHEWETHFDVDGNCIDCPFAAFYQTEHQKYCFRPAHYKTLNDEAQAAKKAQQQAKMQAIAKESKAPQLPGEMVKLSDLAYNQYELLPQRDKERPAGCSGGCECAARAVDRMGGVVGICTDPKRFQRLWKAQDAAVKKSTKAEASRLMARMLAMQDDSTHAVPLRSRGLALALARLMRDIGYQGQRPMKLAAEIVTDPIIRQIFDAGTKDLAMPNMAASVADSLSRRPYTALIDAISMLLLCEKMDEWIQYPDRKPVERIKLLMGEDAE